MQQPMMMMIVIMVQTCRHVHTHRDRVSRDRYIYIYMYDQYLHNRSNIEYMMATRGMHCAVLAPAARYGARDGRERDCSLSRGESVRE